MDLRAVFAPEAMRQRYLDVEAALALAEAELGIIPAEAARAIAAAARVELLDGEVIADGQARTGHAMVPLVEELARVVGDPEGGWVHWGATTQNIQQTGLVLALAEAHTSLTELLSELLAELADLGHRTATVLMPGRTHWQHAVPITFGFKVAAWSDIVMRHLERMDQLAPRLLQSMTGGAAGTFATFGAQGPAVQAGVARRLGLHPMDVPSRATSDQFAELVCVLAMVSSTCAAIAEEVARLMATEFGEVSEPVPAGDVGSSTMPQKRNPKLCGSVVISASHVTGLVTTAIGATIQSHEVDGSRSAIMEWSLQEACVHTGDALSTTTVVLAGLEVFPERMSSNLGLTGGLINAEAVMISLGQVVGRQRAHEVVHRAAALVATQSGVSFGDALAADPVVHHHLTRADIETLLAPDSHAGLSAAIAVETADRARRTLAGRADRASGGTRP